MTESNCMRQQNNERIFKEAAWICPRKYSSLPALNLLHKEHSEESVPKGAEVRNLHLSFQREFELDEETGNCRIRVTADDYYKLYVNDVFVGQGPAQGYWFCYYWNEFDLSGFLHSGRNIIRVEVYYQGLVNRAYNSGDNRIGMIAVVFDGKDQSVLFTDHTWKCYLNLGYFVDGILGYDTAFAENYDSTKEEMELMDIVEKPVDYQFAPKPAVPVSVYPKEPVSKSHSQSDDNDCEPHVSAHPKEPVSKSHSQSDDNDCEPHVLEHPKEPVSKSHSQSDDNDCEPHVLEHLEESESKSQPSEERLFLDFGTVLTGGMSLVAEGKSGDRIRILTGEETDDTIDRVRYHMRCNAVCDETWILKDGENRFEQYEYKSFRYVTLVFPKGVKIISAFAIVRHYPFQDDYCCLQTTDPVLQSVWNICKNGVKYGSQEVYVDCPTREKGQYAGDLTITSASQVILTGDTGLFRKSIENQMQSAVVCKGLLAVTPGHLMQEIADYSLQFPILALRYYHYEKDEAFLEENLKVCEGIIEHFRQFARADGLLENVTDKWNLVDWPENMRDSYDFPITKPMGIHSGCHNVINAFYVGCVLQTEQIQRILKHPCKEEGRNLVLAFNKEFFNPKTGLYTDCRQSRHSSLHSNAIPLYYGINDSSTDDGIADFLVKKKFSCGVYMAYFVLKGLCRVKRYQDAYNLIVSKEENSWYNMVQEGATTCFEAWGKDQKANTSLCHPWASAPISVLAEDILPNLPEVGKLVFKRV